MKPTVCIAQNYALTWNGGWDNGVTTSNWVQYEHTRNSRIPEGLAGGTEGKFNEKRHRISSISILMT